MDIKGIKKELAGMLGTMLQLDPLTGLPYTTPYMLGETVKSYAEAPMSLSEIDLPSWIIYTGPAVYPAYPDQTIGRLACETRDFSCQLFGCVAQAGIDGESERKVEPYIEVSRNLIQSHPLLYDGNISDIVPGIMRAYLIKDDGIVALRYGNDPVPYLGLRFVIRIEGRNLVSYGNE